MSWVPASYLIVGLTLLAGFAWYERSRPSSRLVALVATLAALAALGRMAFAALPDVKPTTDIVLLSGYVLGGSPGFVIGALAALTSNLFFGQGPYTPWQMFAWGLAGVVGAGLGRLSGHRLGRLPLACACAAMGLLFGAIMNLFQLTATGGDTPAQFLVISGQSLPFDVAHAVGNLLFCLAFGPGLVRALQRFRCRLEVTWGPAPARVLRSGVLAVGLTAGMGFGLAGESARAAAPGPGHPAPAAAGAVPGAGHAARRDPDVARGVAYLRRAQNPDGGFGGGPRQSSSPLFTAWAALGLASAGADPRTARRSGHSASEYISAGAGRLHGIGDLERTILALHACGASPQRVGGRDLVADLLGRRSRGGSFGGQVNLTTFAILALRASGRSRSDPAVRAATAWLIGQAGSDGGFNFVGRAGASGIDDTAAAVEGLVAAGHRGAPLDRAVGFVIAHQNPDGGFPLSPGEASNAQSTAWAVQAIVATGRDPEGLRRGGGRSPLGYLRSLMGADGGVRYSRTSGQTPVWVTAQALTALARRPFPIAPVRTLRPAASRRSTRPGPRSSVRAPSPGSARRSSPRSGAPRLARGPRPVGSRSARHRALSAGERRGAGGLRALIAASVSSASPTRTLAEAHAAGVLTGMLLGAVLF